MLKPSNLNVLDLPYLTYTWIVLHGVQDKGLKESLHSCFETDSIHTGGIFIIFSDKDILPQKLNDLSKTMYLFLSRGTVAPC